MQCSVCRHRLGQLRYASLLLVCWRLCFFFAFGFNYGGTGRLWTFILTQSSHCALRDYRSSLSALYWPQLLTGLRYSAWKVYKDWLACSLYATSVHVVSPWKFSLCLLVTARIRGWVAHPETPFLSFLFRRAQKKKRRKCLDLYLIFSYRKKRKRKNATSCVAAGAERSIIMLGEKGFSRYKRKVIHKSDRPIWDAGMYLWAYLQSTVATKKRSPGNCRWSVAGPLSQAMLRCAREFREARCVNLLSDHDTAFPASLT